MAGRRSTRVLAASAALAVVVSAWMPGVAVAASVQAKAPAGQIEITSAVPKTAVLDTATGTFVSVQPGMSAEFPEVPAGFIDSENWHK